MSKKSLLSMKIWGARGSIPTPGPTTLKFGGNTSCVEIRSGKHLIIIDAGSGIRELGRLLIKKSRLKIHLFLSHTHWDHIQGFPFFEPGYIPGNQIFIYGPAKTNTSLEEILVGQMSGPNFPVRLSQMGAQIQFVDLEEGQTIILKDRKGRREVKIINTALNHPNGAFGYRVEHIKSGQSVVYASDTEHYLNRIDENLVRLAQGTELLYYDGQYTTDEYLGRKGNIPKIGWGHSTWEKGLELAVVCQAKRLVLCHHDPAHNDQFVERVETEAKKKAAGLKKLPAGFRIVFSKERSVFEI